MRTCFDIDEHEEFAAARALLTRRCCAWSEEQGRPCEPELVSAALDSRHFSADGRLAYWTPAQIRRFLLHWRTDVLEAEEAELDAAVDALESLLNYLDANGLRDPRGAPGEENREELARIRSGDRRTEPPAPVRAFEQERTFAQLPVRLPETDRLLRDAERSPAVARLRRVAEWLGTAGRECDDRGRLSAADADELGAELAAAATADGDLPPADNAHIYAAWAKRLRLIRRYKGRLVPVAKSARLLKDSARLWREAFAALPYLGSAVTPHPDGGISLVQSIFGELVPDVLNSLYSLPEPMPVERLDETVWQHCCGEWYEVETLPKAERRRLRREAGEDLDRLWRLLRQLGATRETRGVPEGIYRDDLNGPASPFEPNAAARLARRLARTCRLVELTELATWTLRDQLLEQGREAAAIGELREADPAELIGVVSQHYPPELAVEEIEHWLSAHDHDREPLLEAARRAPFRCRVGSALELLDATVGDKLLRRLRSDPVLAPAALASLVENGELELIDLTEPERLLLTAESTLRLLEMEGPGAVLDGLTKLPDSGGRHVADTVLDSGHPDERGLDDFRELVAEPLASRQRPSEVDKGPGVMFGAARRARARRRGRG